MSSGGGCNMNLSPMPAAWVFSRVEVIDDDLGVPSNGIHREGYERLLTAVCNKSVGLVLAIEASRLARGGSDWHMLLEFCAIVGCLVGDRERLYDPAVADDRAYLGVLCRIRHSNPYVVQVCNRSATE